MAGKKASQVNDPWALAAGALVGLSVIVLLILHFLAPTPPQIPPSGASSLYRQYFTFTSNNSFLGGAGVALAGSAKNTTLYANMNQSFSRGWPSNESALLTTNPYISNPKTEFNSTSYTSVSAADGNDWFQIFTNSTYRPLVGMRFDYYGESGASLSPTAIYNISVEFTGYATISNASVYNSATFGNYTNGSAAAVYAANQTTVYPDTFLTITGVDNSTASVSCNVTLSSSSGKNGAISCPGGSVLEYLTAVSSNVTSYNTTLNVSFNSTPNGLNYTLNSTNMTNSSNNIPFVYFSSASWTIGQTQPERLNISIYNQSGTTTAMNLSGVNITVVGTANGSSVTETSNNFNYLGLGSYYTNKYYSSITSVNVSANVSQTALCVTQAAGNCTNVTVSFYANDPITVLGNYVANGTAAGNVTAYAWNYSSSAWNLMGSIVTQAGNTAKEFNVTIGGASGLLQSLTSPGALQNYVSGGPLYVELTPNTANSSLYVDNLNATFWYSNTTNNRSLYVYSNNGNAVNLSVNIFGWATSGAYANESINLTAGGTVQSTNQYKNLTTVFLNSSAGVIVGNVTVRLADNTTAVAVLSSSVGNTTYNSFTMQGASNYLIPPSLNLTSDAVNKGLCNANYAEQLDLYGGTKNLTAWYGACDTSSDNVTWLACSAAVPSLDSNSMTHALNGSDSAAGYIRFRMGTWNETQPAAELARLVCYQTP